MNLKSQLIDNKFKISNPNRVVIVVFTVLTLNFLFSANALAALPATYPWPSWWGNGPYGDICWSSYYNANNGNHPDSTLFTTWRGIQVCGPRPSQDNGYYVAEPIPNIENKNKKYTAYMFQCAELPTRYLRVVFGMNGEQNFGGGNFATHYSNNYPQTFTHHLNTPGNTRLPREGDIVSFTSSDPNGHVAIVKSVNPIIPGTDSIVTFINQNGNSNESNPGTFDALILNGEIQDANGFHATDWISPRWTGELPSAAQYSTVYDMDATSGSNVWTAGFNQPPTTSRRPVIFRWDGSTWTKYLPTPQNPTRHHDLNGITISPSGEVFTVGTWSAGFVQGWQTLAYRWDSSSWLYAPSDNPSPGNGSDQLNDVASDSSGNIYAVGTYTKPTEPGQGWTTLIEKWNGVRFIRQTNLTELPGRLDSVSFSSPSNGWAVGGTNAYHFDGSTWTNMQLPSGVADVYTISDSEAWGAGTVTSGIYSVPAILHYTTTNGWVKDTTFPFYPPDPNNKYGANYSIKSIDGNGPNDIWVSGSLSSTYLLYQGVPFTAHYDGTKWAWAHNGYLSQIEDIKVLPDSVLAISRALNFMSYERP